MKFFNRSVIFNFKFKPRHAQYSYGPEFIKKIGNNPIFELVLNQFAQPFTAQLIVPCFFSLNIF